MYIWKPPPSPILALKAFKVLVPCLSIGMILIYISRRYQYDPHKDFCMQQRTHTIYRHTFLISECRSGKASMYRP